MARLRVRVFERFGIGGGVETGDAGAVHVVIAEPGLLSVRVGAVFPLARELYEETGITADPARLRLVQVVHHRQDAELERIGFFFEATEWEGRPVNKEPEKCLALEWFTVHELPDDIIEYPAAGLNGYLEAGSTAGSSGGSGPTGVSRWSPRWRCGITAAYRCWGLTTRRHARCRSRHRPR